MASITPSVHTYTGDYTSASITVENVKAGGIPWQPIQRLVWNHWQTASTTGQTYRYSVPQEQLQLWNTWTTSSSTPVYMQVEGTVTYRANFTHEQDYVWSSWQSSGDAWVRQVQTVDQMDAYARQRRVDSMPEDVRAARQLLEDERQRIREEASRRRLAAKPLLEKAPERAEELLEMILTPAERLHRENTGKVIVKGGDTGQLYIVDTTYYGVHGNVRETDEHGCHLSTLCVAPDMRHQTEDGDHYGMPLADGFVGQILSIKHNETEFRAKANFSARRSCSQPSVPILGADRVA